MQKLFEYKLDLFSIHSMNFVIQEPTLNHSQADFFIVGLVHPYVFTREDGKPVRDFRGTWANACEAGKVPGLLFHDLRRTAARNLRRAGVAEGVIMKIGGWKTRSVFERYAIVSQSDIRDAMAKLEAGQQRDNAEAAREQNSSEEQFGQSLGRVAPNTADRDTTSSQAPLPVN